MPPFSDVRSKTTASNLNNKEAIIIYGGRHTSRKRVRRPARPAEPYRGICNVECVIVVIALRRDFLGEMS